MTLCYVATYVNERRGWRTCLLEKEHEGKHHKTQNKATL